MGYDGWTFMYDADKRLISAGGNGHSAQFVYDGLGRCVKRTIDGDATVFTFDEWKPIVEWDSSGTHVAWNLYGPGADEILTRYQYNTELYLHYHLDAMGNVQFLMSANNLGLEKYTYDAFGKPAITTWDGAPLAFSQVGNRFMFTGREYLYTFGIYDYRHRHYHPGLGRFLQVDPIGFKGDPMNLYRYCGGNPINHSDPTGLDDFDNLPDAIGFARAQVTKLAFGPNAHKEYIKDLHDFVSHSVGIGISKHGAKFVTSDPSYGEFKSDKRDKVGNKIWYETESYPADAFMQLHSHNNKTGKASGPFSLLDKDSAKSGHIVDKVNEKDPDNWERIGRSAKRPGWKAMNPSAPIKRSDYTSNGSSDEGSGQTASQIDARQRAAANLGTGVPSLGAEAVNIASGPN